MSNTDRTTKPLLIDQPDTIGDRMLAHRAELRDLPSIIATAADLLRRADLDRGIIEDGGDPAEATCLLNDREADALLGLIGAGAPLLYGHIATCVGDADDAPGFLEPPAAHPGAEVRS